MSKHVCTCTHAHRALFILLMPIENVIALFCFDFCSLSVIGQGLVTLCVALLLLNICAYSSGISTSLTKQQYFPDK